MAEQPTPSVGPPPAGWTFLTNHAHVMLCVALDPEVRQRDVAAQVGITERAAQKIITELEEGGFLSRTKVGRRNRYTLHTDVPLRHPLEAHHHIGELLEVLLAPPEAGRRAS